MAETYGVFNWRELPLSTAATLVQGLSAGSRVVKKLTGVTGPDLETQLLAMIADRLGHLIWMFSEDGASGKNHPGGILTALIGAEEQENPEGYDTAEEFMAAWNAAGGGTDA